MDDLEETQEQDPAVARWASQFAMLALADPDVAVDEARLYKWFVMIHLHGRRCELEKTDQMFQDLTRKLRRFEARSAGCLFILVAVIIFLLVRR